jgi:methionyl-tRNA formyltransferase
MTWRVLEGCDRLVVSLIEAQDPVDSGDIYAKDHVTLKGSELLPELQALVGDSTVRLCATFVRRAAAGPVRGEKQVGEPTYFPRRGPEDSRLDPNESIVSQFNLLRVVDNERYPAFFDHLGRRYKLKIEAAD